MLPEIEDYAEVVPVVDIEVATFDAPPAEENKPAPGGPSKWPIRGGRFDTCPSEPAFAYSSTPPRFPRLTLFKPSGYVLNGIHAADFPRGAPHSPVGDNVGVGAGRIFPGVAEAQIAQPAKTVMVLDFPGGGGSFNFRRQVWVQYSILRQFVSGLQKQHRFVFPLTLFMDVTVYDATTQRLQTRRQMVSLRHSGGLNMLYADGHVKWQRPDQLPCRQQGASVQCSWRRTGGRSGDQSGLRRR